jgi:hypothetical protein
MSINLNKASYSDGLVMNSWTTGLKWLYNIPTVGLVSDFMSLSMNYVSVYPLISNNFLSYSFILTNHSSYDSMFGFNSGTFIAELKQLK